MKRTWMILGCALALGMGLTACDDGGTPDPTDSGVTPEEDGSMMMMEDSGPEPSTPVVMAFDEDTGMEVAADFSCLGSATAPTGSGEESVTVTAVDFFNSMPVGGLEIQFFPGNVPSTDGTCGADCTSVTSSAEGTAMVDYDRGSWFAYRVVAGDGTQPGMEPKPYVQVIQANATSGTLNAVSRSTVNTITSVLGIRQDVENGILTGGTADCQGRALVNAQVRLFDSAGQIPFGTGSTDTKPFYFSGGTPLPRPTETDASGLYGVGNVPIPADSVVRVEIWGSTAEGEPQTILGCETVQVVPDGITVLSIGPLRGDGPGGCSGE
ncbi:MAG: hypothetical protein RLO52_20820 [Sandaracinaceae bacterium]